VRTLLPLLLLLGCSSSELGMEYGGERIPLIDMHLHTGEWEDIPTSTQRFLAERFPFPLGLDAQGTAEGVLSADGVVNELDKGGVSQGVLLSVYAPRSVGITTNDFVIGQLAEAPDRLLGLASLRVDRWAEQKEEQLAALREALGSPGMVGIKLAHAHMHFRMDDPAYYGIYELAAELGKPLYLHTGPSPFPGTNQEPPYTDPAFLEEAIQLHPDATFILGHLGFDFLNKNLGDLQTCIDLAVQYDNVFLEPSAMGSRGGDPDQLLLPEAMRRIRDAGLTDRVIYGSDGPQSPGFVQEYAERTLYALEQGGWTVDEAAAAMAGNFARVFGAPTPEL